jgi:Zn-dependent membrane protease YugP
MFGYYYYGFDMTYLVLVVPAILLGLWAQMRVKSTYARYSQIRASRGITADQVARLILDENGLRDVPVQRVAGSLTDHYDPRTRVVRLSDSVYGSGSIAAIGVAAHEVGHAVQHATHYAPMKLRTAIIPVTNIGSTLSIPLILIGLIFNSQSLALAGVALFSLVAVFQLVTLPVEFNASRRALVTLEARDILSQEELAGARSVLTAAALTYVAALIQSLAQLLRLLILVGGNRRRD